MAAVGALVLAQKINLLESCRLGRAEEVRRLTDVLVF